MKAHQAFKYSFVLSTCILHIMSRNGCGVRYYYVCRFDDCVEGGESIVVDTYPVIKQLRSEYPKHFDVLTRVPYTTHRTHDDIENS